MIKDVNALEEAVITAIKKEVDVAVIGLSGGADSTLCAILCAKALGIKNVYGIHMPYNEFDSRTFNSKSEEFAKTLGIKDFKVPITAIADGISKTLKLSDLPLTQVNGGNSRSRARMSVLYLHAHALGTVLKNRVRVIGTGNRSEDWIGYTTKYGDSAGDIFPIVDLYKSEVYQLLDHYKAQGVITERLIARIPSAGLWDSQTDEKELGFKYNTMEPAIKSLTCKRTHPIKPENEIEEFVWKKHLQNKHKFDGPIMVALRDLCD